MRKNYTSLSNTDAINSLVKYINDAQSREEKLFRGGNVTT